MPSQLLEPSPAQSRDRVSCARVRCILCERVPSLRPGKPERLPAPATTPREIIDKLAQHVIAAAQDPTNVAQLTALGIEPNGTTPEEFRAQIDREQPQFDAAIKAANLQLQ